MNIQESCSKAIREIKEQLETTTEPLLIQMLEDKAQQLENSRYSAWVKEKLKCVNCPNPKHIEQVYKKVMAGRLKEKCTSFSKPA